MVEYIKSTVVLLLVISAAVSENCVSYDFEANFDSSFNNDNPICDGMGSWNLGQYSETSVQSPHPESDLFISPGDALSCVSSHEFEMHSTGVLEVLVYMESVSDRDQFVILANEIRSADGNVVTGSSSLTPMNVNYSDGWHLLKIDILGTNTFNGYVTFLGVETPGSRIIVDSFRYLPPALEEECFLYDENFSPPTTPPPTSPDPADCVAYDFEENYDQFTNRGTCINFEEWSLQEYTSIPIESPISESQHFISPQEQISCVSSHLFNVQAGGTIEINVYMESYSESDQIVVVANKIVEPYDVVTGTVAHTPLHGDYRDGWQTLRVELTGDTSYTGYLSFLGLASNESIILIDSFRYIPPNLPNEICTIYSDELFTTTTPPTTTTAEPNGQECVTYNFESDAEDSLEVNNQICSGYSSWNVGNYSSITVENIFPESSTFITPGSGSSCMSSFVFEMKPQGVVEVNVFLSQVTDLDYVIVLIKKLVPSGVDTVAGFQMYYTDTSGFEEGWNVLSTPITDFAAFNGYITLLGSTGDDSLILVDSFRYIPPDTEPCTIY